MIDAELRKAWEERDRCRRDFEEWRVVDKSGLLPDEKDILQMAILAASEDLYQADVELRRLLK